MSQSAIPPAGQQRPLLLLSLDGGGIRGLSAIMILKHIMRSVNDGRDGSPLEPWQVFNMIGGTSTGGLIAIMLGRLRMSLEDCENGYLEMSKSVFTPRRHKINIPGRTKDFLQANGRFNSSTLESAIRKFTRDFASEDALLKDERSPCKVFVVAVRSNNTAAALLRSYRNPNLPNVLLEECKIWEACRATSAATTLFDPIRIGKYGQEFIDGAVRYNNPIQLVHREAESLWPGRDVFILSIGTGSAPGKSFQGNLKDVVKSLKDIVVETEQTANDFYHAHRDMVQNDLLFRFNVYHGLADIGLEEYREISAIADGTEDYLEKGETVKKLSACIGRLRASISEDLDYVDDDVGNARGFRPPQPRHMFDPFPAEFSGVPKFSKMTKFDFLEPRRPRFLGYLVEPASREPHGVRIRDCQESWRPDERSESNPRYAFVGYSSDVFRHERREDLNMLAQIAEQATRNLGLEAYYTTASCMRDPNNLETEVFTLSDVIRGADAFVIAVWTNKHSRAGRTIQAELENFGRKLWSTPELLFSPRDRPLYIYDAASQTFDRPTLTLSRRQIPVQVTPDQYIIMHRLISHYDGTNTLGKLDFLTFLLKYLATTTTVEWLPGDYSYVLMGFLPFRPVPEHTDSKFQAFVRVMLVNDVDSLLERYICHLPRSPEENFMIINDFWGASLRDIEPRCRVWGMDYNDILIVDDVHGAAILPAGPTYPPLEGDGRPQFVCFQGDVGAGGNLVPDTWGGLTISCNGNSGLPPRPPYPECFTLVDTLTMTAIPFIAKRRPVAVLLCGVEGGLLRALLCSYHSSGVFRRESIVRLDPRVGDRVTPMSRIQISLTSQGADQSGAPPYTRTDLSSSLLESEMPFALNPTRLREIQGTGNDSSTPPRPHGGGTFSATRPRRHGGGLQPVTQPRRHGGGSPPVTQPRNHGGYYRAEY